MLKFDYKKEYKEFYLPKGEPQIVTVPEMKFIAIRGKGNPNQEQGEYKDALQKLYAIAYTIKMSYKGNHKIDGYFEYVVPPLEGFWWMNGLKGIDYDAKEQFHWISIIRLPEFVTREDFEWAVSEVKRKKKIDCSNAMFFEFEEGLCIQCMHIGAFDDEPATIEYMKTCAEEQGYEIDIHMDSDDLTKNRYHHEIYLTDARKCENSKMKTVIRYPVRKREEND